MRKIKKLNKTLLDSINNTIVVTKTTANKTLFPEKLQKLNELLKRAKLMNR